MEKEVIKLTILTPTYNRAHLLPQVFSSLQNQTVKNFEWLVIDDGSEDDTQVFMKSLPKVDFPIRYYRKENGGKHTALNYSHPYVRGDFVLILDSDDYLVQNAVECVLNDWDKYEKDYSIGVISYEKIHINGKRISQRGGVDDYYIDNNISFLVNKCVEGDRCEVVRVSLFKRFMFPNYKNEKFFGEGWLWNKIAGKYNTVYRQKGVYICEYLDDGLTKNGMINRIKSPLGMMEYCKSYFVGKVCWKIQLKEMLLYCVYGLHSSCSLKKWILESGRSVRITILLPVGLLLYLYWKFSRGERKR